MSLNEDKSVPFDINERRRAEEAVMEGNLILDVILRGRRRRRCQGDPLTGVRDPGCDAERKRNGRNGEQALFGPPKPAARQQPISLRDLESHQLPKVPIPKPNLVPSLSPKSSFLSPRPKS